MVRAAGSQAHPDLQKQSLHVTSVPRWALFTFEFEKHCWGACAYSGVGLSSKLALPNVCCVRMSRFLNLSKLCFYLPSEKHPEAFYCFDKLVLWNHLMTCVLVPIALWQLWSPGKLTESIPQALVVASGQYLASPEVRVQPSESEQTSWIRWAYPSTPTYDPWLEKGWV